MSAFAVRYFAVYYAPEWSIFNNTSQNVRKLQLQFHRALHTEIYHAEPFIQQSEIDNVTVFECALFAVGTLIHVLDGSMGPIHCLQFEHCALRAQGSFIYWVWTLSLPAFATWSVLVHYDQKVYLLIHNKI